MMMDRRDQQQHHDYAVMETVLTRTILFSMLLVMLISALVYCSHMLLSVYIGTVVNGMLLAMMLRPIKDSILHSTLSLLTMHYSPLLHSYFLLILYALSTPLLSAKKLSKRILSTLQFAWNNCLHDCSVLGWVIAGYVVYRAQAYAVIWVLGGTVVLLDLVGRLCLDLFMRVPGVRQIKRTSLHSIVTACIVAGVIILCIGVVCAAAGLVLYDLRQGLSLFHGTLKNKIKKDHLLSLVQFHREKLGSALKTVL